MASKSDAYFDRRIVSRNIKCNKITKEEYDQYIESLADAAEKAVPIFFEEEANKKQENQEQAPTDTEQPVDQ